MPPKTTTRKFPCPVCAEGLEIRQSKKQKPYIVCNDCGVQLFVRNPEGIARFERLVSDADRRDIWERLTEIEHRYHKKCPDCGEWFWITDAAIQTSWFDGELQGYKCPEKGCKGLVKAKQEEE